MKNTTHRVVILKNVNSELISQAILILKDSVRENDSKLMAEAESIVEKYMTCRSVPVQKNKRKLTVGILSVCIAAVGIALFAVCRFV